MAIYHLSANVISRARGQSAVAAAAYRCGVSLRDERYGITHSYVGRRDVAHAEIMAPSQAPSWAADREALWNRVEAAEIRKDSQLARALEVGLPIELSLDECVALLRDYIGTEFVAKGMIADFCIRRDNTHNPHAHILLTFRAVTPTGFGPKERRWNGKANLLEWRAAWADRANEHLARAGQSVRIDHRTLEAQQIELTPGRRVGFGQARAADSGLPAHLADRLSDQQRIARANGDAILEDPTVVLRALTHQWPTFTHQDIARFLRSRTDAAQFDAALCAVTQSEELVALEAQAIANQDIATRGGEPRFTSRDMVEAAKSLKNRAASMASRRGHAVSPNGQAVSAVLSGGQRRLFEYLIEDGDAKSIVLEAEDMSAVAAACDAWAAAGWRVMLAATSRTGAARWETVAAMERGSLAGFEDEWQQSRGLPTRETVLLVGGAEMLGLKRLERVFAVADRSRSKMVLIGDLRALQAMKVESPFHGLLAQIGPAMV